MLSETHGGKRNTMKHAISVEVTRGNCSMWTRILISAVRRLVYICLSFFKHFLNSEPSAIFGRQLECNRLVCVCVCVCVYCVCVCVCARAISTACCESTSEVMQIIWAPIIGP